MMKNPLCYLFPAIALFVGLFACNDDDENTAMEVYAEYPYGNQLLISGDTVDLMVKDTLTITAEGGISVEGSSLGVYVVIVSEGLTVEKAEGYENKYLIIPKETGMSKVGIRDDSQDGYTMIYINVFNKITKYSVYENYTDIDVEDETLRENIETEVNEQFPLITTSYILEYLKYEYPKEGLLAMVTPRFYNEEDTIMGTFKEKIVSDATHLVMQYNDQTRDFIYEEGSGHSIYLTEDLTEKYQEAYPDQVINKVYAITELHITYILQ